MQASQELDQPHEPAAAGNIEVMQIENADQPMDAETDAASQQLAALQAIPELMEKVAIEPWQYNVHVQLIQSLREFDMHDELETARQKMLENYPLTETLWLEWIEDTKKSSPEDRDKIKQLYMQASQDYLSISIWKSYVDYVIANYKLDIGFSADEEDEAKETTLSKEELANLSETARKELLVAVDATRCHIAESHIVWNEYMAFELIVFGQSPSEENVQRVRALYSGRLKTLHMAWEETFVGFSTFISQHDNANYEETMVTVTEQCASNKDAIEKRVMSESGLVQNNDAASFLEYIKYEESMKSPKEMIIALYERAVAINCTDAGLWQDYVLFIDPMDVKESITVANRAVRNCPWSGILWTLYANILEQLGALEEQVSAIYQRALSNGLLLTSYEDLITTLMARCDFERRKLDWNIENVIELAEPLRNSFKDAYSLIAQAFPKTNDPYYRLEEYEAFIEAKLGDGKRARAIWDKLIKLHLTEVDAWLKYIESEISRGNTHYCQTLFKRAINKRLDYPDRFMDAWVKFEHKYGNVASQREALVLMRRKTMKMSMRWQQQDEATYQAVPYQSNAPETAVPSVELTPEEVERKAAERRRRIRAKSKSRSNAHRQRVQTERAEHQHEPAETRKRRRFEDQGDDEEAQANKLPKITTTAEEERKPYKRLKNAEPAEADIGQSAEVKMDEQADRDTQTVTEANVDKPAPKKKDKPKTAQTKKTTAFMPLAIRRRRPAPSAGPARRLAVPKKKSTTVMSSSAEQPEEKSGNNNKEAHKAKSNDEFRAMFLKQ